MTYLNQLDLQDRIYLIVEKISELGRQYSDDLRLGKSCALKHKQQLLFLEGVLEILKCYEIYDCQEGNCLEEKTLLNLLDFVSKEYNICFSIPGNLGDDYYRITTENCSRITTNMEQRIYI